MRPTNQGRINNKGTKVLFKNRFLERLSRTHISVPILILSVYSLVLLYYAFFHLHFAGVTIVSLFLAGFFTFTFVEYIIHRYLFHMDTSTRFKEKVQYAFHGIHHEYPKDKDRLAMPPLLSFTLATIFFLLFQFLMGEYVYVFLPGFLIGYSSYLGVHFAVHAFQPPNNFLKVLWINHGIHHYKDHDRAFGVSSPFWDFVFRTLPPKKK